jgi:hypothetical protein
MKKTKRKAAALEVREVIAAVYTALANGQNVHIPALAKATNTARNTLYEAASVAKSKRPA